MRVITAPEKIERNINDIMRFLAGGITGCHNWQKRVIDYLKKKEEKGLDLSGLVLLNPRRDNFPIGNIEAAEEQITWEFNVIDMSFIFSIYFCGGESDQPICMYELGKVLGRRFALFRIPDLYNISDEYALNSVIVDVENGYKREQDVVIQTKLMTKSGTIVNTGADPISHAERIIKAYNYAKDFYQKWNAI